MVVADARSKSSAEGTIELIDLDKMRKQLVQFNGLTGTETLATLYYDETNNIRKLHISERGLNVANLNVFVLGGIVHMGIPRPLDLDTLRDAMWIQKNASEIKLKHVAPGTFPDLLQSTNLTTLLKWISDNDLLIHYQALDPFFWSVVDIVDSLLHKIGDPMLIRGHLVLKSDLTEILRADFAETIDLFHRYSYPSLAPESRAPFLNDLIALVKRTHVPLRTAHAEILEQVLRKGLDLDGLVFIEDNAPLRLIDDFSSFYVSRIALFNNAVHILDMEEQIRDRLQAMALTRGGVPAANFTFVDSKTEPGIQLSDVVVGLLGKLHSYFTQTRLQDVASLRAGLRGVSLANAELLKDCIARSHDANTAFLNHVMSAHDLQKLDCFLRFSDGAFMGAYLPGAQNDD
jgi:hypothetical protein